MNDEEFKAIDQRLAAMSERVDAVIEKESRGKPMPVLDFKPRAQCASKKVRNGTYCPDPARQIDLTEHLTDGSIESIFADFERQFDEMAQAHRYRA